MLSISTKIYTKSQNSVKIVHKPECMGFLRGSTFLLLRTTLKNLRKRKQTLLMKIVALQIVNLYNISVKAIDQRSSGGFFNNKCAVTDGASWSGFVIENVCKC